MTKILEILGLGLVVIMSLGFVGAFQPTVAPGLTPLFWGCAGATLVIIMYRKMIKKREEST